jgi:hypothetical protein
MSASASKDETFDRIRSEISRDLNPVRPMSSGWIRALFVLPYFVLALAFLLLVLGLRSDAEELGGEVLWGLAAIQLLAAYSIFTVALRQAVPGNAVGPAGWLSIPLLVIVTQVGVALWTYRCSPLDVPSGRVYTYGLACFSMMTLFGVVPVAMAFWLLARGLPLQPRVAGLLTGLGSGLAAEAVYRMHCSYSHWSHILPWHGGAVLFLGLVGFYCGFLWEKRRLRQYENYHRP